MIKLKVFFLCIFTICIFTKIYSNDISDEEEYIFNNIVTISRIDSFFFQSIALNKLYVASSLLKYKDEEAVYLFNKMLNDERVEFQNYSIFPLINAGQFEIAFAKYKELILNNKIHLLYNLQNFGDDFSNKKMNLYKKHKKDFIPFLKEVCYMDSVSYEIKFRIAELLYFLDEKKEIEMICEEILEKIPEVNKQWKYQNPEEKSNNLLIAYAKEKLRKLKKKK